MTRILVIDDHAIVRQAITQFLVDKRLAKEVIEAATGEAALRLLKRGKWNLVLLDIALPDHNGLELLRQIRQTPGAPPVLMFSMYGEELYGVRALKSGAAGYLCKTAEPAELEQAVRQTLAGRKYLSVSLAETLARYIATDSGQLPHEKLSSREYQTLCLLGSGKRLSDVADILSLSVKTVSVYRTRLLEKLNLANNAELTYYVLRNHLVEMDSGQTAS